jgi:oxygen-independent coproporphyrinogen-3 oxidase
LGRENWQRAGFGLYLHWPFCQAKCPYCDFNSFVSIEIDQQVWLDAYISEIDRIARTTDDRTLSSLFFGGGTPSLMEPFVVDGILQKIQQTWALSNDMEITLEANPSSVEAERFRQYAGSGVNRVSLGVQALNNQDLQKLGRLHTAYEALAAIETARKTFDRVSFDLIYARQDQTLDQWSNELAEALSMQPDHLSLYQLTIEDGTAFGDRAAVGKLKGLPSEDLAADMFELTQEQTRANGLPAYEVSNHAASNQQSRHNLIYWRGGDYAGIGPGAHGRITNADGRIAIETELTPSRWLTSVRDSQLSPETSQTLSNDEWGTEYLMMALRLGEGFSLEFFEGLVETKTNNINALVDSGVLVVSGDNISVSEDKAPVLNAVIEAILR